MAQKPLRGCGSGSIRVGLGAAGSCRTATARRRRRTARAHVKTRRTRTSTADRTTRILAGRQHTLYRDSKLYTPAAAATPSAGRQAGRQAGKEHLRAELKEVDPALPVAHRHQRRALPRGGCPPRPGPATSIRGGHRPEPHSVNAQRGCTAVSDVLAGACAYESNQVRRSRPRLPCGSLRARACAHESNRGEERGDSDSHSLEARRAAHAMAAYNDV
jgi:hypothetical protein